MDNAIRDPLAEHVRACIRDVPDFPQPGILFKDITPLLADAETFAAVVRRLADPFADRAIDQVVGIEARGFIFAAPVALALGSGFVPIRKPRKLPYRTVRVEYALEYGTDALEAHEDAIRPGQRVLVVDDVLATGGTAAAAADLVERLGGTVAGMAFVAELSFLEGRARLRGRPVESVVTFDEGE
ncbi:MAG TPA: adenine phosphoribosyltransferase [Longimicrobiales bacterium]